MYIIHVFLIHINIFQQNKYSTAARQENYKVRPVTSTNFLSAKREIMSALYRHGQTHNLNTTLVRFS
jgi:hypothetical protein